MSIVNGRFDRRSEVLASCNLLRNPFFKAEPPDEAIDTVFVGREEAVLDAAMRVYDGPRNLLVVGGYGYGKTTFVRKLLRELRLARRVRFLTGYSPLRYDSAEGLQLAALSALVEGMLELAEPDSELHEFALSTHEELARLGPEARGLRAPDLRFRQGLKLLHKAGFHRAVIAIDELDKREARVVQDIVMGARYLLDTEASFILTGRYMDLFSDIRSSLMAAFDHRLVLRSFNLGERREILRRNLAAARRGPEPVPGLAPFESEAVELMVERCKGLPRPLNLMAYSALELALREWTEPAEGPFRVGRTHLEQALQEQGRLIYNDISERSRELLRFVFQHQGYVSTAELGTLTPTGDVAEAVRELEQLTREDALLRMEEGGSPAFTLAPPLEHSLQLLKARRARLKALWERAMAEIEGPPAGQALEEFARVFFEEAFTVTEVRARADTEEIDLVLEVSRDTAPVFRKGAYLLVECKRWRKSRVDAAAVTKLAGALASRHLPQGFLLTTGEFTSEARQQAANAAMALQVEVLLIDGASVEAFLEDVQHVQDFLRNLHRRQLLRLR